MCKEEYILERKSKRPGMEGRLPASAPLANPYVPFQMENPPKYEPGKALVRGTLFPGLDLPFKKSIQANNKLVYLKTLNVIFYSSN